MKGRKFVGEAIIFICSMALCIVAAVAFIKRDDKAINEDSVKIKAGIEDIASSLSGILERQKQAQAEVKALGDVSTSMISDLSKRITDLENRKPMTNLNDVNLKLTEPIKISLVYREAMKKPRPLIGETNHTKSPLLHRAGVLSQVKALGDVSAEGE
jgi:hypothetical protein